MWQSYFYNQTTHTCFSEPKTDTSTKQEIKNVWVYQREKWGWKVDGSCQTEVQDCVWPVGAEEEPGGQNLGQPGGDDWVSGGGLVPGEQGDDGNQHVGGDVGLHWVPSLPHIFQG